MQELSLHILDVLENAREAGATKIILWVLEDECKDVLKFKVIDNGRGMDNTLAEQALNPFTTSRQTRKVGLGLALLKATAEASGGKVRLASRPGKGTRVEALFQYSHVDRPPMGNLAGTISVFLVGAPGIHLRYVHRKNGVRYFFDSQAFAREMGSLSLQEPSLFPSLLTGLETGIKN